MDGCSVHPVRPSDDSRVCVYEIWDRQTQRVYTMAEGCRLLAARTVQSGQSGRALVSVFHVAVPAGGRPVHRPSLVDLTEKLQDEHNTARDRYNEHRDLIRPGYIASADINKRTIDRFKDSELGEIVLIDAQGQPDPAGDCTETASTDRCGGV